jgi:ribosome-associated protein
MAHPVPVAVRTGIRLGQFLKLADAVDQGSDAKAMLAAGDVAVNGEQERRRGRQLAPGDVVSVLGTDYVVTIDEG